MNPRYPIYVISKGRWESRLTVKALIKRNIPFKVVVEPQEYGQYSAVIDPVHILQLPFRNLGQGSIPARNWVWEHSIGAGAERHWILDDNLRGFLILSRNQKYHTVDGATFAALEDFTDRYQNVALSGMQYEHLVYKKRKWRPIQINARIYSCILINNALPHRWRGRYNEDTDLAIQVLRDGWCTILFWGFLADKMATMTMKGGNTEDLYEIEQGRYKMAKSLQDQHPDVVKIKRRWGRWQHVVDYRPFKHNRLIRQEGLEIPRGVNNYGMKLASLEPRKAT